MKIKYLLITAVLITVVLGFGGAVKAQSATNCMSYSNVNDQITCLTNLITQLTQQLTQLQNQQGATQWCHTFNKNLRVGDSGAEVQALDVALEKEGFSINEQKDNPPFADPTASAVVGFQEKYASDILTPNRLTHGTGYVGPSTRAKLNSLYGCGIIHPTCTPNWQCGWGSCVNGYQSQTAIDSNNCGLSSSSTIIACPALARTCTNSNSITINSVSGPNSLNVGQTGTWIVNAAGPSGTNLSYSVDWGYPTAVGGANTYQTYQTSQTSTFTHSYSQAGTYTVRFTVSGLTPSCPPCPAGAYCATCIATNNSAQTSITVVVGNISNALSITSPADLTGFVSQYYDKTFSVGQSTTATGRTYTWSIINGSLPPGLSITYFPVPTCGVCAGPVCPTCFNPYSNVNPSIKIAGTPTVYGDYSFALAVTDDIGNRGSINLKISIGSYSSTPSIIVTSPNGGEIWKVGETHNITWQASGFQGNNINVWLTAVDYSDHSGGYPNKQYPINILPNGGNGGLPIIQGSYSWTIPSNFVNSSQMKINISVVSSIDNEYISRESANYFSIVAPMTTYTPVSLANVINYASISQNNYVTTYGTVVGFQSSSTGDTILLTDNNGNYLLATVAHAFVSQFSTFMSQLYNGKTITVQGVAAYTSATTAGGQFGITINSANNLIGMINLVAP